jgi:hypothetical protein
MSAWSDIVMAEETKQRLTLDLHCAKNETFVLHGLKNPTILSVHSNLVVRVHGLPLMSTGNMPAA